jgi:hypothetical protein
LSHCPSSGHRAIQSLGYGRQFQFIQEKSVVTQLKQQNSTAKLIPPHLRKLDGKHVRPARRTKANHAQADQSTGYATQDAGFTEQPEPSMHRPQASAAESKAARLVARGKDLMAGDTGSVVTAAAVVVGAALIEVELIPGLLIGAGAILLGKFFPELGAYVRPAIKGAVRAGFSMTQKVRELMAETSEQVHDLVAEVRHEQDMPQAVQKIAKLPVH